ncbi:hypothetical protein [Gemmatimonas groenlandica]|uniref:Carboxypeptidase regulatory-like domain-containing protein n=1 Tax=Gemmatimonas groenlandica TaxID=2732249 RepID=A0A6M4INW2_9BACT|nr:hypothetical protein [Gemmatimonas groenlandica]QJR36654.1 hypothetical protein HKW67_14610 [Gemmatimonas groenlandica]
MPIIRALSHVPLFAIAVLGCAPAYQAREPEPLNSPSAQTIRRGWSVVDDALAARQQGRLAIIVRSADHPLQTVSQARTQISLVSGSTIATTPRLDSLGVAHFDSLTIGIYRITVTRLGYARVVVDAPVELGCRTDVEVYVGMEAIGMNPPPPTFRRAVATLCPRRDARAP